jgi:hypothetical protein
MNDQEFKDAYELYKMETKDESKNENDKSGGETKGSEYDVSEDDDTKPKRKKRRTTRDEQIKEKEKKGKKKEEEDALNGKTPAVIIDVDALLKSSSKKA